MNTDRKNFVRLRNAFSDAIEAEIQQGQAVPCRYAEQRAAVPVRIDAMRGDYAALCEISAMAAPTPAHFERAASICKAWGVA